MKQELILNREYLEENYLNILKQNFSSAEIQEFLSTRKIPGYATQSSSGSGGKPLLIVRSLADLKDITFRVLQSYVQHYSLPPQRVALIGGISHLEAAANLNINKTQIRSFELSVDDFNNMAHFDPEVISCYPSVLRSLISEGLSQFKSLKAIKLGGEIIFTADIKKALCQKPNLLIVEQLGSTEMPAVACRTFGSVDEFNNKPYVLQRQRFDFLFEQQSGWVPLIVKDNFLDLKFNIHNYYDTGDEVLLQNGEAFKVRRRDHLLNDYYDLIASLLESDIENLQIDTQNREIFYKGNYPSKQIVFNSQKYLLTKVENLQRIPVSNKLALVLGSARSKAA